MIKKGLSVALATFNEEQNLDQCLSSIKNIASEIVIADGGSTDHTVKIAQKYKAKIISTTNKPNFHINKNMAIDACTRKWILQLDADEVVSNKLAEEINQIVEKESEYSGYWVNRKNWFLTRFLTKGGQYPDPTIRLYKNGSGRLPAIDVHEQAKVEGKIGYLENDLLHYRDLSFEKYLNGFNRYSTFISLQMKNQNVSFGILPTLKYLFVKPLYIFLKIFIRHKGFVDGFPGFIFALFSGLVHPVAYIKYWQHKYYPHE